MSLILSGTNGVSDVDGTAATPAIRGTDTNTGIFFPAADTIAFAEGGVESARFDSAGNLGIGTSSPLSTASTTTVEISNATTSRILLNSSGAGGRRYGFYTTTNGNFGLYDYTADTNRWIVDSSGNLGIGTNSPNGKLRIQNDNSTIPSLIIRDGGTPAANMIEVSSNATGNALILNASGNLGLGVTPSAWTGSFRALQVRQGSISSDNSSNTTFANNAYFDGSNWRYINSAAAQQYLQFSGQHVWTTAASGTAGNAISFTQAMTLDAGANFLLRTTTTTGTIPGTNFVMGGADGANQITFQVGGVRRGYIYNNTSETSIGAPSGGVIKFQNDGGGTNATIDSGGRLLIAGTNTSYASGFLQLNAGKAIIASSDSGFGQFQIGGPAEASIGFFSGVTAFGVNPTSSSGDTHIWAVGTNVFGIGGGSWGIGNKGATNWVARINWNSTSWIFSSDERLKDVEGRVENALDKVAVLRPVYFTWKNDEAKQRKVGLLAQDVLQVLPEAVTVPEQETREDGSQNYLGLGMSDLVPLLTAAIQEQQAIIQTLTTRIAALEAK